MCGNSHFHLKQKREKKNMFYFYSTPSQFFSIMIPRKTPRHFSPSVFQAKFWGRVRRKFFFPIFQLQLLHFFLCLLLKQTELYINQLKQLKYQHHFVYLTKTITSSA